MTNTIHHLFAILLAFNFIFLGRQGAFADDAAVMTVLKTTLNPPGWSDPDPCKWTGVGCSDEGRIIRIQLGQKSLQGTLPPDLQKLERLERLELGWNDIAGPVPSLSGLSSLQVVSLTSNQFTSFPADFFLGLSALQFLEIDNNPFSAWEIPQSLRNATALRNFSANSANITGNIPDFLRPDEFPSLSLLHLAINSLEGELPATFAGSHIQSFWVNGQKSAGQLTGSIDVIQNMTMLKEVWLHSNAFTGPLPDFSGLGDLESLSLRDNKFTGPVPASLVNLKSLKAVNLTYNLLQGPMPVFDTSVSVDMVNDSNSFCLPSPGDCDPRVNTLLSVLKPLDYPQRLAQNWKGNDPCAAWLGITCSKGVISVVNLAKMGLTGTISPDFASLKSLQRLILSDNNLTGSIPAELTTLAGLKELNVSNNQLYGKVPAFTSNIILTTKGNPDIGKEKTDSASNGSPAGSSGSGSNGGNKSSASIVIILVSVLGGVILIVSILLGFYLYRRKQKRFSQVQSPKEMVIHPRHSGSDNESMKITVAGSSASVGAISEIQTVRSSEPGEIQMVEAGGNKVFSIQVLRNATNNFSENNILGQGGFGVVYQGELPDGTKTAVKRMESGVISGKGFTEFKSEITVLTKVRHRHLVTLLGYCLDGNEKLLVYEFMPQGTLSRHLFHWAEEGLKSMEWTRRLTIALDVARGVEYLHGLAHQSFIHRDLKPSNILLGDDMRAKVADFGLVRLAPEGKGSIETRIAGTFGYLAPEYAVTGRVTTKVDVYSFGVILMEIITGRKALDESQPEENMHLVTYFRRMYINKDSFRKSIDPTINLNEETLASVHTVAELAGHCCAREPFQRPDMGHVVNVISSLVEFWKPSDLSSEDDLSGSSRHFDYSTLL